MDQILSIAQIILSIVLIALILMQQSEGSLGSAFGGSDSDTGFRTRRGSEKFIFNATIVVGVLFALSALISFLI